MVDPRQPPRAAAPSEPPAGPPSPVALGDALGHLAELVAFDTVSDRPNLPLIRHAAELLESCGAEVHVLTAPDGVHANLFATLHGSRRRGVTGLWRAQPQGLLLSGHTDVVPVRGQAWTRSPFAVTREGERIYGRGTADMKGFVACVLASARWLSSLPLREPVHIALSYDEEVGCRGVPALIEALGERLPTPRLCVVGEPTSMRVVTAHKGISVHETRVVGAAGHSSAPDAGVNAVHVAARLIAELERLAGELDVGDGPASGAAQGFEPPRSTFNVGVFDGGTAVNVLAPSARFVWEVRPLPGVAAHALRERLAAWAEAEVLPGLRARHPSARVEISDLVQAPPLHTGDEAEIAQLARRWAEAAGVERPRGPAVSFATEAGLFDRAGVPTVICGPGDIAQAHQPDEFVTAGQLQTCLDFLAQAARWCAQPEAESQRTGA